MIKLTRTLPTLLAAAFAATLLATPQASATEITGAITFAGGATFDTPGLKLAKTVTAWSNTRVVSADGDFGGIAPNTAATFFAPWTFNPSTPTPGFWSVGGFSFDLLTSTIVKQTQQFLLITGTGTISGNGFDPTAGSWSFSTQAPSSDGIFSFSASSQAPDGGATLALLGTALAGLELVRRKVRA